MAFRLLVLLKINSRSINEDKMSTCILYKNFPIIEKRTAAKLKETYVPLPLANEIEVIIVSALGLNAPYKQFSLSRDSCNKIEAKPIFKLATKHGILYPVLLNEISGIIVGGVLYPEETNKSGDFSNGFGIAFDVLNEIGQFYLKQKQAKFNDELSLLETRRYLSIVCPFGKPRCMNSAFGNLLMNPSSESQEPNSQGVQSILKLQTNSVISSSNKILNIRIKETLISLQHQGQAAAISEFAINGSVCVTTNLQDEVSVALSTILNDPASIRVQNSQSAIRINHCLFHPSCHYTDYTINTSSGQQSNRENSQSPGVTSLNMRFIPTLQVFNLLLYKAQCEDQPIRGVYQMQPIGDDKLSINFQLQLSERLLQKDFKNFEVIFPFPNRPSLSSVSQVKATHGKVDIPQNNRHVIMWIIGTPNRIPVLSLKGEVKLFNKPSTHPLKDSFCTHLNAYAQVNFTMNDFNFSGLAVDSRSLIYNSDATVKLGLDRQFVSSNFKIWNTLGDSPAENLDVDLPELDQ